MLAIVTSLLAAHIASAATLTMTPDKGVYQVDELIVISIFGDAEGAEDNVVRGRILFDPDLAESVESSQELLTSPNGPNASTPWLPGTLELGEGFADAFFQGVGGPNLFPVDNTLSASVTLRATAPGTLDLTWQTAPPQSKLLFFAIGSAPGTSVQIVPEPSTAALFALGIALMSWRRTLKLDPQ